MGKNFLKRNEQMSAFWPLPEDVEVEDYPKINILQLDSNLNKNDGVKLFHDMMMMLFQS